MTEKLYYIDAHQSRFTARVLSCRAVGEHWQVETDKTCFFPEGGGQKADTGTLGKAAVLDVQERGEELWHLCDTPLEPGSVVEGAIDWEQRFGRMQLHSGEHIVSGLAHSLFGCENVGFHMSEGFVTIDLSRELSGEELCALEEQCNRTVWENRAVLATFPDAQTLQTLPYRSKKEIAGAVRVVDIQGIDRCACCAPHVSFTGEIGLILLTDSMRHRGGVRLTMRAGHSAWAWATEQQQQTAALSAALSAPRQELGAAVARLQRELEETRFALSALRRQQLEELARSAAPTEGNLVFFLPDTDSGAVRALVNLTVEKCALCAVFTGEEGAWRYVIGSRREDLRACSREINAAIAGRGGGSAEMIQGSAAASRAQIEAFFGVEHGQGE